jgi:hypothetical protein
MVLGFNNMLILLVFDISVFILFFFYFLFVGMQYLQNLYTNTLTRMILFIQMKLVAARLNTACVYKFSTC